MVQLAGRLRVQGLAEAVVAGVLVLVIVVLVESVWCSRRWRLRWWCLSLAEQPAMLRGELGLAGQAIELAVLGPVPVERELENWVQQRQHCPVEELGLRS